PGQTDPTCAAYDLAIGPTCLDGSAAIVPLCNHGSAYAPAGITITRYPAGTFDATPDSPPGVPHHRSEPLAAPIGSCTSTEQIPPGACIEVACSASAGEELLANGPPSDAAECRRDDNWGLFVAGSCGAPICSGNASQAVRRKRHLFIAVDRSAQMDSQPPQLLWWAASAAVKRFAADQDSAGMHIALRFFPDPATNPTLPYPPSHYVAPFPGCDAESGASCGGFFGWSCSPTAAACMEASCAMPLVEGDLVAELAPTDRTEANLIAAIDATAPEPASSGGGFLFGGGGSPPNVPLHPMLEGALSWAEAGKLREPDGEWAVVLITSALPQGGCDNDVSHAAALAAAANAAPFGIKTHVIGLQSAGGAGAPINQASANAIASAGGTGQAYWISAGDAQASQSVVDALQAIGTDATLCTVNLPNPGAFDPAQASVSFIPGVPPGGITPGCRYDQVLWNGRCYASEKAGSGSSGGFFGFGGSSKTLTWKMSRDLCRSYGTGWDLAKIDSAAEGNFLRTTFATTVGLGFPAWIGGNSISNLRDWRWSSDGSAFWSGGASGSPPTGAYANWAGGEPTVSARCGFLGGSTCYQQCVQLRSDGTWQDASCTGNGAAVCEGPLLGSVEECEPGHLQGADGRCYYVDKTARTFDAARASCQANGTGWDLAVPTTAAENAYLAGFALDAANDAWIGVHDPEPNNRWQRVDG
ncbi:MAG: C-type lectin domain-containing protein, partial [Deltaproteobacteria bacterium]|nr:C-type lectin domain-containing protein [Deltaproteobacteria bacterium]